MDVIDRRVGLSLSKWRWHGVDFFSVLMGLLILHVNVLFEEQIASPPGGRVPERKRAVDGRVVCTVIRAQHSESV
jgi:hypothetical protein